MVGLRRQGFTAEERGEIKKLFNLLFCCRMNLTQARNQAAAQEWSPKARRLLEFVQSPSKKGVCPVRSSRGDD